MTLLVLFSIVSLYYVGVALLYSVYFQPDITLWYDLDIRQYPVRNSMELKCTNQTLNESCMFWHIVGPSTFVP